MTDPEVNVFYYIGLTKLKFKRAVLKNIDYEEALRKFLINYSETLVYTNFMSTLSYFNSSQRDYTNQYENMTPFKKFIINNID